MPPPHTDGRRRLTELGDGMSKEEKYSITAIVVNLNPLPKLLLQCDLINHGIKLKTESIWILTHGNTRVILLKSYCILPRTFAVGLMTG